MKAIQIRYLGPTNFKPSRLKVWAEGVPAKTYSYDHEHDTGHGAKAAAQSFADLMKWGKINDFAVLPNGDYVATLKGKNND